MSNLVDQTGCPACGSDSLRGVYRRTGVPTNSCILVETREAALSFPKGDLDLYLCSNCGFVHNAAFDPRLTEYSGKYEETQAYSPIFNAFNTRLAQELIDRHGLYRKNVLEIGCGKGEFLKLLCELGENWGVGYDPSFRPDRFSSAAAHRMRFERQFFSNEVDEGPWADLIACKMTLEHIPDAGRFTQMLAGSGACHDEVVLFFQIPDCGKILDDVAFWDIYYEHCSYFTAGSLSRLFQAAGFHTLRIWRDYDDQYLMIECRPVRPGEQGERFVDSCDDIVDVAGRFDGFGAAVARMERQWLERVQQLASSGGKVVVWGSGSKGVAFLHAVPLVGNEIEYVVDVNPNRHGKFMPGTGQEIVGPDFLIDYRPDLVIVMNQIYLEEIARALQDRGLFPSIEALAK